MKIYFIGQKGIPTHGGGVEHYVENLATRLANKVMMFLRTLAIVILIKIKQNIRE